jgi:hypothetical protein
MRRIGVGADPRDPAVGYGDRFGPGQGVVDREDAAAPDEQVGVRRGQEELRRLRLGSQRLKEGSECSQHVLEELKVVRTVAQPG